MGRKKKKKVGQWRQLSEAARAGEMWSGDVAATVGSPQVRGSHNAGAEEIKNRERDYRCGLCPQPADTLRTQATSVARDSRLAKAWADCQRVNEAFRVVKNKAACVGTRSQGSAATRVRACYSRARRSRPVYIMIQPPAIQ